MTLLLTPRHFVTKMAENVKRVDDRLDDYIKDSNENKFLVSSIALSTTCSDNPVLNSVLSSYIVDDLSASFLVDTFISDLNHIYQLYRMVYDTIKNRSEKIIVGQVTI